MKSKKWDIAHHKMNAATQWLAGHNIPYDQPTAWQIKIFRINFWPCNGKIFLDGELSCRSEVGLNGLETVLIQEGLVFPPANLAQTRS